MNILKENSLMKPVKTGIIFDNWNSYVVVFDVYIDQPPKNRVLLMDFNPWGEQTDGLLFEWEDLEKMDKNAGVTYKIVESQEETQDLGIGQYKVPIVSGFL